MTIFSIGCKTFTEDEFLAAIPRIKKMLIDDNSACYEAWAKKMQKVNFKNGRELKIFIKFLILCWGDYDCGKAGKTFIWPRAKKISSKGYQRSLQLCLKKTNPKYVIFILTKRLNGIGISYGSKILRMMSPEKFAVLDSKLAELLYNKDYLDKHINSHRQIYADFLLELKKVVDCFNENYPNKYHQINIAFVERFLFEKFFKESI